jgi:UDP-GlcNAc:undecaprenyl-phosphate/decaprenyl-phosphate GlcNAc-1-phosphate transferase
MHSFSMVSNGPSEVRSPRDGALTAPLSKGDPALVDLLHRAFGDSYLAVQFIITAATVLGLSLVLTPLVGHFARRWGILAPNRARDVHTRPTPRLGGVAIFLSFVVGMVLFEPLTGKRYDALTQTLLIDDTTIKQFRGVLLGATIAVIVGVIDDILTRKNSRGLRPSTHFLGQVLAAVAALVGGLAWVRGVSNPLSSVHFIYADPSKHLQILLTWSFLGISLGMIFTVFWIVGMMNTVNFMDGLDGLAGGVVTIAAILLAIWSGRPHGEPGTTLLGSQVLVLPPLILAAALLGFLVYNWAPARIFMGDSGAQFAGFTLGALAILGPAKIGTALLILTVPILDVAWVFIRRPIEGRAFFSADSEHLHHRLLKRGFSQQRIVLIFYGMCVALGLVDLLLSYASKLLAFLLVVTATVVVLIRMTARRPADGIREKAPVVQP